MNDWPLKIWVPFMAVAIAVLAVLTVYNQVDAVKLPYISTFGKQMYHHTAVVTGRAMDPWQYRMLAEWILDAWLGLVKSLPVPDFAVVKNQVDKTALGIISLRLLQNYLLFGLAFLFYRYLGLDRRLALTGLVLTAWCVTQALFSSDMSFNTYFDLIFYLAAALIILRRWDWLIIPLAGLALLNRETSLLIPVMLAGARLEWRPKIRLARRDMIIAGSALALQMVLYLGIRAYWGPRALLVPYGHPQGLPLLIHNLTWPVAWLELMRTLSLVPVLGLIFYRSWPMWLKRCFWSVAPVWFVVHYLAGYVAETRLFLVPMVLLFVPGLLFGLVKAGWDWQSDRTDPPPV